MQNIKLFLASSSELAGDRKDFEVFINRKNNDWIPRHVHLELILWEDFLDAVSKTRLQEEYNQEIRKCDIFVMLFFTKVGRYTEEEFETAFGQFKATNKPFIFTYFKDAEISTGNLDLENLTSLKAFQKKLDELGHFYTRYKSIDELKFHFNRQLDKLAANGFFELNRDEDALDPSSGNTYQATLAGHGAIAQGPGAKAVGAGGVLVDGNNSGKINTGTQIDTGGGAYVGGNVHAGRDFIGRDKITREVAPTNLEPFFASFLESGVATIIGWTTIRGRTKSQRTKSRNRQGTASRRQQTGQNHRRTDWLGAGGGERGREPLCHAHTIGHRGTGDQVCTR
jgi:hypothetical protein